MMNKKIEEMSKCCTYYDNGECLACTEKYEDCDLRCDMFGVFANLEMAGYRRQDEVAREIFAEIEEVFFKYADKYSSVGECKLLEPIRQSVLFASNELFVNVEELKKKYGVQEDESEG